MKSHEAVAIMLILLFFAGSLCAILRIGTTSERAQASSPIFTVCHDDLGIYVWNGDVIRAMTESEYVKHCQGESNGR